MQVSTEELAERRALGLRLRRARGSKGLSQADVAATLGMARQSVNRIEAGLRGVDALELIKLCELYERSVLTMLCLEPRDTARSEIDQLTEDLSRRDYEILLLLARSMLEEFPVKVRPVRPKAEQGV